MKAIVIVFLAKLFFRLLVELFFSSRLTLFCDLSFLVLIVPIGLLSPDLTKAGLGDTDWLDFE